MTEVAIQDLVDYFHDEKAEQSPNYKAFIEERIGEKDVEEVYGVGPEAAAKLREKNIFKAWQLLGFVINNDKDDTLAFLKKYGVAATYAKAVAFTLVQYFKKHNCD